MHIGWFTASIARPGRMSWTFGRFPRIGKVNGRSSDVFPRPFWSGETKTLDVCNTVAVLGISLGQFDGVRKAWAASFADFRGLLPSRDRRVEAIAKNLLTAQTS